jgi:Flp pilus assembly protein TadG
MKSMRSHARRAGTSLVEFALVLPLLVLLVIGGASLFVRNLYRDALDEAAEQAAWAAARTGGDVAAIQGAVQRSIPFAPIEQLSISATSTGYHAEVAVIVGYRGEAITSLPFFNAPLVDAQATATNQQERAFTVQQDVGSAATEPSAKMPSPTLPPSNSPPELRGPVSWPDGPAALPGGQ